MAAGSAAQRSGSAVAWRVVSDVDHTLLEEPGETPSAGQALRQLGQRGIPTLLASSKTFAEMVAFQSLAELPPQPFLFENGCGIGWPTASWPAPAAAPQQELGAYGAIVRGGDPQRLRSLLHHLRANGGLRFSLLEELNFGAIQQLIGLEEPLARLALQRLGSMPLVWQDDEAALGRLRRQLAGEGLGAVSGGRLVHVAPPCDKAEALAQVLTWLGEAPHTTTLLACGDSENDRALLESADVALVFHPTDRPAMALTAPTAERPRIMRTAIAAGPTAWLAAVEAALAEAAPALTEIARAAASRSPQIAPPTPP
jgi:mannosyl-3-phosphoglycerate phosphatase family protein